jgi:hypothetical protein
MEHKKYSDNKSGVNEKSCSPKNMSEANFRASAIELVDFFKLGDKAHFYVSLPPENVASKVISEAALMLDADVLREEFTAPAACCLRWLFANGFGCFCALAVDLSYQSS